MRALKNLSAEIERAGGTLVEIKVYGSVFGAQNGTSDIKYVNLDNITVREIPTLGAVRS